MSQHFLLSTAARSLSLARVARMSEEEARDVFKQIRWSATGGEPFCPRCGCVGAYEYKSRPLFKCKECGHQFSVTSGTIFSGRKLPIRTYLLAIAIFANGAKGHSALQLRPAAISIANTQRPSFLRTSSAKRWRLRKPTPRYRGRSRSTAHSSAAT